MMALFIAVGAVMVFAVPAAPPSDESVLLKLEDDWIRALETRDGRRLDEIVAKEFTFIEPDGTVKAREEYLADRSGDSAEIESFTSSELGVRVNGASALVTGVAHITERRNGNRYRYRLRWKELWLKQAGRWQVLAGQATPVNAEWDRSFIIGPDK
jgi:ketosteroid isomerase-like protein